MADTISKTEQRALETARAEATTSTPPPAAPGRIAPAGGVAVRPSNDTALLKGADRARLETIRFEDIIVTDGDTIKMGKKELRILGMDAPEAAHPEFGFPQPQEFATEATRRLTEILKGAGTIQLVTFEDDMFGRPLVHIFADGRLVADQMIAEHLAYETISRFGTETRAIGVKLVATARAAGVPPFADPITIKHPKPGQPGFDKYVMQAAANGGLIGNPMGLSTEQIAGDQALVAIRKQIVRKITNDISDLLDRFPTLSGQEKNKITSATPGIDINAEENTVRRWGARKAIENAIDDVLRVYVAKKRHSDSWFSYDTWMLENIAENGIYYAYFAKRAGTALVAWLFRKQIISGLGRLGVIRLPKLIAQKLVTELFATSAAWVTHSPLPMTPEEASEWVTRAMVKSRLDAELRSPSAPAKSPPRFKTVPGPREARTSTALNKADFFTFAERDALLEAARNGESVEVMLGSLNSARKAAGRPTIHPTDALISNEEFLSDWEATLVETRSKAPNDARAIATARADVDMALSVEKQLKKIKVTAPLPELPIKMVRVDITPAMDKVLAAAKKSMEAFKKIGLASDADIIERFTRPPKVFHDIPLGAADPWIVTTADADIIDEIVSISAKEREILLGADTAVRKELIADLRQSALTAIDMDQRLRHYGEAEARTIAALKVAKVMKVQIPIEFFTPEDVLDVLNKLEFTGVPVNRVELARIGRMNTFRNAVRDRTVTAEMTAAMAAEHGMFRPVLGQPKATEAEIKAALNELRMLATADITATTTEGMLGFSDTVPGIGKRLIAASDSEGLARATAATTAGRVGRSIGLGGLLFAADIVAWELAAAGIGAEWDIVQDIRRRNRGPSAAPDPAARLRAALIETEERIENDIIETFADPDLIHEVRTAHPEFSDEAFLRAWNSTREALINVVLGIRKQLTEADIPEIVIGTIKGPKAGVFTRSATQAELPEAISVKVATEDGIISSIERDAWQHWEEKGRGPLRSRAPAPVKGLRFPK